MSAMALGRAATDAKPAPASDRSWQRLGQAVDSPLFRARHRVSKRLFDVLAASLLLIVTLPLAAAIALAVFLESGGPVFFVHPRLGKGGGFFRLWKFRSMWAGADAMLDRHLAQHPDLRREWRQTRKLKNDARITRVGRWLRRSSLDELPQLWNVLRGSMSLVGPRPIVLEEAAQYGRALQQYERVQPGLTGLWQVSGRTDLSYRRRVDLDTQYIRQWSLALDLKILCQTVPAVLRRHGAY